jgi:hypothetical protein
MSLGDDIAFLCLCEHLALVSGGCYPYVNNIDRNKEDTDMQAIEQKTSEINKLNKYQRATMKSLWNGREIGMVIVDDILSNSYPTVRVKDGANLWLIAQLGPRGAVHAKRFEKV